MITHLRNTISQNAIRTWYIKHKSIHGNFYLFYQKNIQQFYKVKTVLFRGKQVLKNGSSCHSSHGGSKFPNTSLWKLSTGIANSSGQSLFPRFCCRQRTRVTIIFFISRPVKNNCEVSVMLYFKGIMPVYCLHNKVPLDSRSSFMHGGNYWGGRYHLPSCLDEAVTLYNKYIVYHVP